MFRLTRVSEAVQKSHTPLDLAQIFEPVIFFVVCFIIKHSMSMTECASFYILSTHTNIFAFCEQA